MSKVNKVDDSSKRLILGLERQTNLWLRVQSALPEDLALNLSTHHVGSQASETPIPRDPISTSRLQGYLAHMLDTYMHAGRQTSYTENKNNFLKNKEGNIFEQHLRVKKVQT